MKNDFSYRLRSKNGAYYYIYENRLFSQTVPVELNHAPDGWGEKSINWKRGKEDFGVVRSFSIPLKFVWDGAEILRYLFYNSGYEADCVLEIMQLNNSTNEYEPMYIGEADFKTFNDDKDYVTINTIEGGFQQLVKTNEDIEFEIPIASDPEAINVLMGGLKLRATSEHQVFRDPSLREQDLVYNDFFSRWELQNPAKMYTVPLFQGETNGTILNILINSQVYVQDMGFDWGTNHFSGSGNFLFSCIEDTEMRITGAFSGRIVDENPPKNGNYEFLIKDQNRQTVAVIKQGQGTTPRSKPSASYLPVFEFDYEFTFDITQTFRKNSKYFIVMKARGMVINEASTVNLTFENEKPKTLAKALRPETVLKRICEKIGGIGVLNAFTPDPSITVCMSALSSFLKGQGESSVLKISLNQFYKFCNAVFSATKYTNQDDQLVIGPIKEAFNDEVIIDLESVNEVSVSLWTDLLFNTIKAGYKNQTYEDINGKLEFNSEQVWKANVNRVKNELDMMCPLRADGYGIESKRIELDGKPTMDSDADNDVFILHIDDIQVSFEGQMAYPLKRRYPVTSGATASAYNVELSPRWNLVRNWAFIKSLLWNTNPLALTIQSSAKNKDITVIDGGPPFGYFWNHVENRIIQDGRDLNPSQYEFPVDVPILFIPVIIKFNPLVSDNIYLVLKSNPRGKVKFNYKGFDFYGFVKEVNIQPKTEETTNWEVICAPETDLKKLTELISLCEIVSVSVSKLPDGDMDKPYTYFLDIRGSDPKTLISFTLPDGLSANFNSYSQLYIGGTPTEDGAFTAEFVISNCGSERTIQLPFFISRYPQIINFDVEEMGIDEDGKAWVRWQWTNTDTHTEVFLYKGAELQSGYPKLLVSNTSWFVGEEVHELDNETEYTLKIRIKEGSYEGPFLEKSVITQEAPPVCVPSSISTTSIPDGNADAYYHEEIDIDGTAPFYLNQSYTPDWLSAYISDNKLILEGLAPTTPQHSFAYGSIENCNGHLTDFYFDFYIN